MLLLAFDMPRRYPYLFLHAYNKLSAAVPVCTSAFGRVGHAAVRAARGNTHALGHYIAA